MQYWKEPEVVTVTRTDGSTFEVALNSSQLSEKVVIVDQGTEEVHILQDAGAWREMTEQEVEQERRAWSADMADMERIKQEWREYREG